MTDRDAAPSYSGKWLRSRTDAELEQLLDDAMPKSPAFEGVLAELTRRQGERSERRQLFWIKLTFWTGLVLGCLGIAATLLKG